MRTMLVSRGINASNGTNPLTEIFPPDDRLYYYYLNAPYLALNSPFN